MGEVNQKIQQENRKRMAKLEEEQNERNRLNKQMMDRLEKEQKERADKIENQQREMTKRLAEQQYQRSLKLQQEQRERHQAFFVNPYQDFRPKQYAKVEKISPQSSEQGEIKLRQSHEKHKKEIEQLKRQNKEQVQLYAQKSLIINSARVKDDSKIKKQQEPPQYILCPITCTVMTSPMIITSCGHTFEEQTIKEWLRKENKCPLCSRPAKGDGLVKNFALAQVCAKYR